MPEIFKPTRATHYFFMDGDVVHTGVTDPGLVTTSGLSTMIKNTDEEQFLLDITPYSRKLPVRPARDEDAIKGVAYDDGGTPKIIRRRS